MYWIPVIYLVTGLTHSTPVALTSYQYKDRSHCLEVAKSVSITYGTTDKDKLTGPMRKPYYDCISLETNIP